MNFEGGSGGNGGRIPGVMLGTVKSKPDNLGQVEVEFRGYAPFPRTRVPIATPLAGKKRGLYFMPELDDQVLVAFNEGKFEHPFIVGFVWNSEEPTPETDRQNRVIVTPGGHQLRFEDGTGRVVLESKGGNSVVLDDNTGTITVTATSKVIVDAPNIDLTDGAPQSVVLGDMLQAYLQTIVVNTYNAHSHLVFGLFPVSPPIVPMLEPTGLLSTRVKTG
jgi:uncharacterized protein involved in type VI secretion and phage assembly